MLRHFASFVHTERRRRVVEKGERGKEGDRPPRHVNEFFEVRAGRAGTIDKRRELEVRGSREVGVVWQQRRKRAREK